MPVPELHHHSSHSPSSSSSAAYPPIPAADATLKPPPHVRTVTLPNGQVQVATPTLEPQPWVKSFVSWLARNTTGVARVDLRRPTLPYVEQYEGNNLLFASYKALSTFRPGGSHWIPPATAAPGRRYGRAGHHSPQQPYYPQQAPPYFPNQAPQGYGLQEAVAPPPASRFPTGARVKITRSFMMWKDPRTGSPLVDIGAGVNIDMDRQVVEPVARLKLRGLLSVKALPTGLLKISKQLPLGFTGMSLKVHYEVPLRDISSFWQPPARLMVRLDRKAGSGVHFTSTGIEFDEQLLKFGNSITLRGAAGITFPRTLPFDPETDDFGFKVHRLSLKTLW